MNIKKLSLISSVILSATVSAAQAQTTTVVIDDDYASNGTAAAELPFFASSTGSAIEIAASSIGLVSGNSSRMIHAIFPTQTLDEGDTLIGTITFTTPATTAGDPANGDDIRFGFLDHLGRGDTGGALLANTMFSSGTPNPDWSDLPGYALELDVENAARVQQLIDADIAHRRSNPSVSGRALSTTTGFDNLTNGPDIGYFFDPNTSYTVTMTFEHLPNGELGVTSALSEDGTPQGDPFTSIDAAPLSFSFGLLGINASSNGFGTTTTRGLDNAGNPIEDNGIEITSVNISFFDADGVDGGPVDPVADENCYTLPADNGNTAVFCL